MGGLGAPELLIILVIVLLVFGGAKLPKLAKSLGEAQKEFRHGTSEAERDEQERKAEAAKAEAARAEAPKDGPIL